MVLRREARWNDAQKVVGCSGFASRCRRRGVTWQVQDSAQGECSCNNVAAGANLTNAVTGARTYYVDSGRTFLGLTTSESLTTSSIQEIGTGLSFVSGSPSTNRNVISTKVGGGGSFVVLTAFDELSNDCLGILDLTKPLAGTVLGISKSVGTYFFVIRRTLASGCGAARITSVTAFSRTGFPSL